MVKEIKEHIIKVRGNDRQKQVTIPSDAEEIEVGDYVKVKKNE